MGVRRWSGEWFEPEGLKYPTQVGLIVGREDNLGRLLTLLHSVIADSPSHHQTTQHDTKIGNFGFKIKRLKLGF